MIRKVSHPFRLIFFVATLLFLESHHLLASDANPVGTNAPATQNAEDQCRLAHAYFSGEGVQQSYEKAGYWWRKAADQGSAKGMHNLGLLFLDGLGAPKNEAEGYKWVRRAAEKGNTLSEYLVGKLLLEGRGVARNPAAGLSWIQKAADAGNADALARLGQDYYFGDDGLPKDLQKAVPLIKAAAEKGDKLSCQNLGILYLHGEGVPKNSDEADYWFGRSHLHGNY